MLLFDQVETETTIRSGDRTGRLGGGTCETRESVRGRMVVKVSVLWTMEDQGLRYDHCNLIVTRF